MIRLEGIHKYYNRGTAGEVHALNNFDIEVRDASFVVVLGANGSGKSTLLQLLAGSTMPDAGNVTLDGINVTGWPEYKQSKWVSRVFQNPLAGTCATLSIVENFRLAALRSGKKGFRIGTGRQFVTGIRERIAALGLGLENKMHQQMGTLSGGQRQALTLLMAVMDQSKLILLDEPTAALDPRTAEVIMQLADRMIREHKLTALMVTHSLRDALRYGDRLIQLQEGRLVRDLDLVKKQTLTLETLSTWY